MNITLEMREAAQLRAEKHAAEPGFCPEGTARLATFATEVRAKKVTVEGRSFYQLDGYASKVETPYVMYDWAGPYNEVVSRNAFEVTLSNAPDVAYLVNHKGVTMARTTNKSLTLSADDEGLLTKALVNPGRTDVKDLVIAIEDKNVTEMSFAFQIVRGLWSPNYDEFRIEEVDLDRGDVSAVNYGANPYTSVAARSQEILRDLRHLPAGARRAALHELEDGFDIDFTKVEDDTVKRSMIDLDALRARLDVDNTNGTTTSDAADSREAAAAKDQQGQQGASIRLTEARLRAALLD
jgi:HK97 family phage prohead protease